MLKYILILVSGQHADHPKQKGVQGQALHLKLQATFNQEPNPQLIQTFAFHATLMSILFTVSTISSESFRIPASVIACATLILVGIAFFCPLVLQVSWRAIPTHPANTTLVPFGIDNAQTMLLGAVAGVIAGIIGALVHNSALALVPNSAATSEKTPAPSVVRQQLIASFALVGLALGWQSVVIVLLFWLLVTLSARLLSVARSIPASAHVMGATLLHLLSWSLIFSR